MKRKKKKYLLLIILAISIGFAALTAQIGIFGDAHFIGGRFDVHFENLNIIDAVEGPYNTEIGEDGNTLNFSVQLEPNDSFAFTVDVANGGSLNAIIENYSILAYNNGEQVAFPYYINYEILFTDYGVNNVVNEVINVNSSRNITVRLTYNADTDYIPEENIDYTFQLLLYFQKTDQTYTPPTKDFTCQVLNNYYGQTCEGGSCLEAGYNEGDYIPMGVENENLELIPGALLSCSNSYTSAEFFYVSDYYDTETNEFNSDYATLVQVYNAYGGPIPYNNGETGDSSIKATAYLPIQYLPHVSEWGTQNLYTQNRVLRTNTGNVYFDENEQLIYTYYSYFDRAARLLTTQEVERACGITVGSETVGELDSCKFLMFNTRYISPNSESYWLETGVDGDEYSAFAIDGTTRSVKKVNVGACSYEEYPYSVRAAIEIPKSSIIR